MRLPAVVLLCLAVVSMTASPVVAQRGGGSILWLVPPAGELVMNAETAASLSASDYFGPDDIFIDVWQLQGRAGEVVTVDMKSADMDAFLYALGPGLGETLWDDDSAGRCDARITIRFLEDGVYRIAATTHEPGRTGVYTLLATADPTPPPPIECGGPDPEAIAAMPVAGVITAGEPVSGQLDNSDVLLPSNAYGDAWTIEGEAGVTVTIRLESQSFDAYLYVVGPGILGVLSDDDSGGDLNSEISLTFSAGGTHRIVVSSVSPGSTGTYTLSVTRNSP